MPDGTGRETGPAATMSPAGIITPRSATCGPDCHASPCTLRQMRQAQRAAEAGTRITLWAELPVLAHLAGWTMPFPGPALAGDLRAVDARLQDCALAHATDAAVAARAAGRLSAVAWGLRSDTALERATGAKATDQDWAERLASQLDVFRSPCRWPLDYLKGRGPWMSSADPKAAPRHPARPARPTVPISGRRAAGGIGNDTDLADRLLPRTRGRGAQHGAGGSSDPG